MGDHVQELATGNVDWMLHLFLADEEQDESRTY